MTRQEVILTVRLLTDDPRPEARDRLETEVRRSLGLLFFPENVYVEQAVPA